MSERKAGWYLVRWSVTGGLCFAQWNSTNRQWVDVLMGRRNNPPVEIGPATPAPDEWESLINKNNVWSLNKHMQVALNAGDLKSLSKAIVDQDSELKRLGRNMRDLSEGFTGEFWADALGIPREGK